MQLGMIGLGRMGANMVRRLMKGGHQCVVYDVTAEGRRGLARRRRDRRAPRWRSSSRSSAKPRAVWLMVPAARRRHDARQADAAAGERTTSSSTAATRYYIDDIRRAKELKAKGLHYVDVGTSGGVWGLERGYCHDDRRRERRREAPRPDLRDARAGRRPSIRARPAATRSAAPPSTATCTAGRSGAGHFVKMVHNGIEYGVMAAYAEGFDILKQRQRRQAGRTRPTPRRRRCATRSTTSTTSTSPTSPRSGGAAA